jgi:GAF domain-containing protein
MAVITLVDEHRQRYKSEMGLGVRQTPRSVAFCAHTIRGPRLFQVPDARDDPRFSHNPLVTGAPGLRFYAGMPLQVEGGHRLGALAVLDRQPRRLTSAQASDLESMACQVIVVL